jgi:hypothetical protein
VAGYGVPANQSSIQDLVGMAVDGSGNLYIADTIWIRNVNAAGIVTTIAGKGTYPISGDEGPAIDATFDFLESVAADAGGNVYIGDNGKIRKITPDGIIHTVAGTGTEGYAGGGSPALAAQLHMPLSLAADGDGNLYIAAEENYRIGMVSAAGTIATVAGNGSYNFQGDGGAAVSVVVPPTAAGGDEPVTATSNGASAFGGAILAVRR